MRNKATSIGYGRAFTVPYVSTQLLSMSAEHTHVMAALKQLLADARVAANKHLLDASPAIATMHFFRLGMLMEHGCQKMN